MTSEIRPSIASRPPVGFRLQRFRPRPSPAPPPRSVHNGLPTAACVRQSRRRGRGRGRRGRNERASEGEEEIRLKMKVSEPSERTPTPPPLPPSLPPARRIGEERVAPRARAFPFFALARSARQKGKWRLLILFAVVFLIPNQVYVVRLLNCASRNSNENSIDQSVMVVVNRCNDRGRERPFGFSFKVVRRQSVSQSVSPSVRTVT